MKTKIGASRLITACMVVACTVITLSGCDKLKTSGSAPPPNNAPVVSEYSTNTAQICVFSNDDETGKCKSGQTALFAPQSWGNEQLPVIFAAKYCDFGYPIVHTNGAVSCVFFKGRQFFKPEAPKEEQPAAKVPPAP